MPDKSQPDAASDDFDRAARINFRDYPSSALVVLAALSSGLAWMAYKWLGKKGAARRSDEKDTAGTQAERVVGPSKAREPEP